MYQSNSKLKNIKNVISQQFLVYLVICPSIIYEQVSNALINVFTG